MAGAVAIMGLAGPGCAPKPELPDFPAGGPTLYLLDARVRVLLVPESRRDFQIESGLRPEWTVSTHPPKQILVINGRTPKAGVPVVFGLIWPASCEARPLPENALVIRTPLRFRLVGRGAITGTVKAAEAVSLDLTGCSGWRLERIATEFAVRTRGRNWVEVAHLNGALHAQLLGHDKVHIESGHSPRADVSVIGSAEFLHGGSIGGFKAVLFGSGRIHVAEVWGEARTSLRGMGDIDYSRVKGRFCGGRQTSC